ncbi:ABC transporter permease [Paucisalibacillus globulus]|jgi:ABC-2 type transport system permease protein|uniref:ABC transporter permease n=1 Tax=Paucisalibacillus globulus TaxID=351095 RepID=UPI000BB969F4|nr:ABC transporter permease [Paucisalibacillus globulus]
MTLSWKRINAILQKDWKDLWKNYFVSSIILLPIVMAVFYGRIMDPTIDLHYMIINLALASVTAFIQCAVIAEEKEKHTLRGLMLSPASVFEILIGKSLVTIILSVITIIVCAYLTGYNPTNIIMVVIALIISMVFYLGIGTILGLISRTIIEASFIIMPVIFLFGFGSVLMGLVEKYPSLSFVEYLPNIQLIEFAYKVEAGAGFGDLWSYLAVITAWAVVGIILSGIVYKKRQLDD